MIAKVFIFEVSSQSLKRREAEKILPIVAPANRVSFSLLNVGGKQARGQAVCEC